MKTMKNYLHSIYTTLVLCVLGRWIDRNLEHMKGFG